RSLWWWAACGSHGSLLHVPSSSLSLSSSLGSEVKTDQSRRKEGCEDAENNK
ncbi:conserved hypothetical protein, partial [Ricinus communis]